MDIESVNKEYVELKKELQKVSDKVEDFKERIDDIQYYKQGAEYRKSTAKRDGDSDKEKIADKEIKGYNEDLTKIINESKEERSNQIELNGKINDIIENIKNNPEIQEHLNKVMVKRYGRQIRDINNDKEQTIKKKDKLMTLQQVIIDHPSVGNNLIGTITAIEQGKRLQEELDKLDTSELKDRVRYSAIVNKEAPEAAEKYNKNKTLLMSNLEKFAPEIKETDIKDLAEQGFAKSKDGKELDLQTTLNRRIKNLDSKIKGYDKQIAYHTKALEKVQTERVQQEEKQEESIELPIPPKPKFEWRHPIKSMKAINEWNQNYANSNLDPIQSQNQEQKSSNQFRDSMKYEMVQNIAKEMEEENFKAAKEEVKKQNVPELDR